MKIKLPKYYGLLGLCLIIVSFFYWNLPFTNFYLTTFNFIFLFGNILLFDFLSYELSGFSFLHSIKNTPKILLHILLIGSIFSVAIELYAHWFGKFWYYPQWNLLSYSILIMPVLIVYAFYLIESYMGIKAILYYLLKRHRERKIIYSKSRKIFLAAGIIGVLGLGISTIYIALSAAFGNSFEEFLSVNAVPILRNAPFIPVFFVGVFAWLFFEYLEYERHETSLICEILQGNFIPLISVFIAAIVCSLVYEGFNAPAGLWRYANVPLSQVLIFNVPILIFVGWPFQFFPLLAMYRVFFKKETDRI